MNRPKALNALNSQTVLELGRLIGELNAAKEVRVVVVTGGGDKAFVAGADITEMVDLDLEKAKTFAERGQDIFFAIEQSPKPWIAAVNGFALGGGCELAVACDFIYASRAAKFGQPEVNLGIIPGFGGTQRLARRVGVAKARELIYTGAVISAEEALRIGLVDKLAEPADLLNETKKTAQTISDKGPLAITGAKRAIREGEERDLRAAMEVEARIFAELFTTKDREAGMKAFMEKRSAQFEGK